MAATDERTRQWRGPALFSFGFRPFFLGAAVWAVVAMAVWLAMLGGRDPLAPRFDLVDWHAHEFLFGYLGAVIAGFLLTAVPNWTGRPPVVGGALAALAALWLAGRLVVATGVAWPAFAVALIDLSCPAALAFYLLREIVVGRNWRNLIVLALLLAFLTGNALFHLAATGSVASSELGLRLGVAAAVLLVAVIGGRIVPSFTLNWLKQSKSSLRPAAPMQGFDRVALLVLLAALVAWVALPETRMAGTLLVLGGLLHAGRLARWRGWATLAEPLVWALHLAYAFLPLGALVLGGTILAGGVGASAAGLHIWTIGAIGTMTLAVMTRATLGHTGAPLQASAGTTALYLAMPLALALRLAAPISSDPGTMHLASGLVWILAFVGFIALYGPRLLRARPPRR